MQLDLPYLQVPEPSSRDFTPPPPAQPHPVIEFVRVRRARRYILRVRPDGSLRVTVPSGGSRREAEQFVRKHQRWISRERRRVQVEHAPREWKHGSDLLLRGETVRLDVAQNCSSVVISYGDRQVSAPAVHDLRAIVENDLRELATLELIPRLRELAAEHSLTPGTVVVRNQRSRWGSCSGSGNIALNFRLVQMPPHVRDYVLLHELMHMKQQNHSRRFWRLVESVCPGFRDAERWLKSIGRTLF